MTLEQLLSNTPDKLEALTDKELNAILSPYFNVTRPDMSKIKESHRTLGSKSKQGDLELQLKFKKAEALAKKFGIEL